MTFKNMLAELSKATETDPRPPVDTAPSGRVSLSLSYPVSLNHHELNLPLFFGFSPHKPFFQLIWLQKVHLRHPRTACMLVTYVSFREVVDV
jgi:hypothetical protein